MSRKPAELQIAQTVRDALDAGEAVVALESTIAHGLPCPINIETALAAETIVREVGAVPATIAIWQGSPTIGLTAEQIDHFGRGTDIRKASRRDIATAMLGREHAATTVSATMALAHRAGISIFATGGIGGVHPDVTESFDISADLTELARTPVLVVCAGAKNILDLPRTLELLETLGVPVVGFGADEFPAFYVRGSGRGVSARVDTPEEAADLFQAHRDYGSGGMLLCLPIAIEHALSEVEFADALAGAEADARDVIGPARTPFLLKQLAHRTDGRTLNANRALIQANARLAATVARNLSGSGI